MKILGINIGPEKNQISIRRDKKRARAYSNYVDYPYSPFEHSGMINSIPFDGEKNPYELGTPIENYPDYYSLRIRAWDAYLKTDIVQNAIRKYCLWIVGSGLKIQSEPLEKILSKYASTEELKNFSDNVETQFRLYAELKESVNSEEYCLHIEASESLKNAIIAGDILCINRFDGKKCTLETIDGRNITTPLTSEWIEKAEKANHEIISGVEINKKGGHVAYYVAQDDGTHKRILAYGSRSKRRQVWLMYGNRHRKSDIRGVSLLTQILETTSKMDRYKDATLGSAEENSKIPYYITHESYSSGENPFIQQMVAAAGKGKMVSPETMHQQSEGMAVKVAQSTEKNTYNMPPGAKLNRDAYDGTSGFKEFFGINLEVVYTTLGIPPEVAQDKFGGAYSGSRAALKSWEHKIKVERTNVLKRQFYQPFFNFWLDIAILKNEIQAPGYIEAMEEKDYMVLGAYRNCRFIGPLVPHIDPVKEVNAIRKKLGKAFENVPLDTLEKVMEELNSGDFENVANRIDYEKQVIKDFMVDDTNNNGIEPNKKPIPNS